MQLRCIICLFISKKIQIYTRLLVKSIGEPSSPSTLVNNTQGLIKLSSHERNRQIDDDVLLATNNICTYLQTRNANACNINIYLTSFISYFSKYFIYAVTLFLQLILPSLKYLCVIFYFVCVFSFESPHLCQHNITFDNTSSIAVNTTPQANSTRIDSIWGKGRDTSLHLKFCCFYCLILNGINFSIIWRKNYLYMYLFFCRK